MPHRRGNITSWLEQAPSSVLNAYAIGTAFVAYFCMYAFRKPFTAATYSGLYLANSDVELKTAFIISQVIGYTLSKFLGIKIVSEARRHQRLWLLIGLVVFSELAFVLFAVVPPTWKVFAVFLNGLPLGMVWGLVVRYLEGRRTSDILLAALSCSFIVSSGVFKDFGRAVLEGDQFHFFGLLLPNPLPAMDQFWMPAATGLLVLPVILTAFWFLNQVPEPTQLDVAERTERAPMSGHRRFEFFTAFWPGLLPLIIAYVLLTVFRDFRDNFMVEVLDQLGYPYAENKDIMSRMELGVALGVFVAMALLYLVKDNRRGLLAALGIIAAGFGVIGVATVLHLEGAISGFWWMALIGFGSYIAYVPYNSVLFDRLMASTHFVGTAVFAIYLADTAGYTGSVLTLLYKDRFAAHTSRAQFLETYCGVLGVVGVVTVLIGGAYFWQIGRVPAREGDGASSS
ncbi:MAG: DUF5690 family protein [Pirellulales bacterium]